ncbi:NR LBD domain-containing protein [Aphelenchoides fujianensis]|nr:NR LBD domain-containing protein [Aphelenchoides fujianensis]
MERTFGSPLLMSSSTILTGDRLSRKTDKMKCLVCTADMSHFNLGVRCCRACSSFFRRTCTERLRYVCQASGNCNVELAETRTKCKACRLEKCLQIGLTEASLKNRRVYKGRTCMSESPPSCVSTTVDRKPAKLLQIVRGYDEFLNGQRALFAAAHPELGSSDKYCMPKMVSLAAMQQKSIPLLFQMLSKSYGQLTQLNSNQKINLIKASYQDLSNLHRCFLTSVMFPELDDTRIGVTNGYFLHLDMSLLREFMDGYMNEEKVSELAKQTMGLIVRKILRNCHRFKVLKIRKEDVAVLWFLSVFKHAERLELTNEETVAFKEEVVREWANDLTRIFGEAEGPLHLARVLSFHIESDMLAEEMDNIQILAKVRWPNENNGDVEEFLAELSLED